MSALQNFKLKLHTGGVASNKFRVELVFIHDNGLLLSDIIREDIQHAKPEFLYKASGIGQEVRTPHIYVGEYNIRDEVIRWTDYTIVE